MSLLPSLVSELLSEQGSCFHDACLIDQDGVRHPVNKGLLATRSKFFMALFRYFPKDETDFRLNIVKRTSDNAYGLGIVLKFMEVGELELNDNNVLDILQTAMYVGELELMDICVDWLGSQIQPDNAIGFWNCAKELYLTKLMDQAWDCISLRCTEAFESEEFLEQPQETVSYIFGRDELTCREEDIWIALERWVNYGDRNQRMEAASTIMKKIRFGLLELEYFRRVVRDSSLMMETVRQDKIYFVLCIISLAHTKDYEILNKLFITVIQVRIGFSIKSSTLFWRVYLQYSFLVHINRTS